MLPSLFISYSRREAPFVDSLYDILDDQGLRVWLDYHSLVPFCWLAPRIPSRTLALERLTSLVSASIKTGKINYLKNLIVLSKGDVP